MSHLTIIVNHVYPEEKALLTKSKGNGIIVDVVKSTDLVLDDSILNTICKDSLVWIRTASYNQGCIIAAFLESKGYRLVTSEWMIRLFGQKILTDQWMQSRGFNTIPGRIGFSFDAINENIEQLGGFPVILKPNIGGFGRFVNLIQSELELEQSVNYIKSYAPAASQVLYLQKKLNVVNDLRVLFLNGEVLGIMERSNGNHHASNIELGGSGNSFEATEEIQNILYRLGEHLSAGFLGVDLLVTEENVYVCEVNAVCRYKEFMNTVDPSLVDKLLDGLVTVTNKVL